jgi:hypothetical protein
VTTEGGSATAPADGTDRKVDRDRRLRAHVEGRMREVIERPGAPEWLCQYIDTVSGAVCHRSDSTTVQEPDRTDFGTAGRLFSILFTELDRRLSGARTGRLIRVAVQTDDGGAYCYAVVPGNHIVGIQRVERPAGTTATDRLIIELVDRLRADIGQPDLDFGGVSSRRAAELRGPRPSLGSGGPSWSGEPPHVVGDTADPQYDWAVSALDGQVLQWLAVVQDRAAVFIADRFDDEAAEKFFMAMGVEGRRRFYEEFAGDLTMFARRLDRMLRNVLGGPLVRLVLDLQEGALVVHRLGPRRYLLGITLDQTKAAFAEDGLRDLLRHPISADNADR